MAAIIPADAQSIIYATITSRFLPLLYLGITFAIALLGITLLRRGHLTLQINPILNLCFIATSILVYLLPDLRYVRICLFLMTAMTCYDKLRYDTIFITTFTGYFLPTIGSTTVLVEILGFDPIVISGICVLAIISYFTLTVRINSKVIQEKIDGNLGDQGVQPLRISPDPSIRRRSHDLGVSLQVIGLLFLFTFISVLSYDLLVNSLVFYFLMLGIFLSMYSTKQILLGKRSWKIVLLILLDICGSLVFVEISGLSRISILYPGLIALVLIMSVQFSIMEFKITKEKSLDQS